ncbi:MAG: hypothetical protein CR968_00140 [Flavobacteriia bacterium]|nr:MAG: hypothetical protein CR968_00140 [Flavobacteriia bacterium]
MGFDISYHPIKEEEIQEWYFEALEKENTVEEQAKKNNIEDFYKEKYKDTISTAKTTKPDEYFDKSHGYYIAVVQGFFRKHFYLRGTAFSFLVNQEPIFEQYIKQWQDFLPFEVENPIQNRVFENYCSGVFIPADQVKQLLNDYKTDEKIRSLLDNFYSDGHISVFLKALEFAKENNTGLLEASEVIEPNPLDLNNSISYSNLFNCDPEGALIYQKIALQQIADIEKANKLESGTISQNATYQKTTYNTPQKEKKSFWKRLFGK